MENLTRDRTMEVCLEVMSKTIMANFRDKSKPFSCGEVHRAASAIGIAEYKVFAFYVGIFKEYLEEIGQRDFSEIIQGFEISEDDRKQISYFLVRDDVLGKKKLDIFISSITTEDTRELEKAGVSSDVIKDLVKVSNSLLLEKFQEIIYSGRDLEA